MWENTIIPGYWFKKKKSDYLLSICCVQSMIRCISNPDIFAKFQTHVSKFLLNIPTWLTDILNSMCHRMDSHSLPSVTTGLPISVSGYSTILVIQVNESQSWSQSWPLTPHVLLLLEILCVVCPESPLLTIFTATTLVQATLKHHLWLGLLQSWSSCFYS